jgi:hypothetical protein
VHLSLGSYRQNSKVGKLGFPHKSLGQGFIDLEGFIEEEVAMPIATLVAMPVAMIFAVPVVVPLVQ